MPQPSAEILHALTTSLSAAFTKGLAGVTPQYLRIATEVPSGSASNTYGWLSDLPTIKEWVRAPVRAVVSVRLHHRQQDLGKLDPRQA
jgi:phage major head subunit gpT-like protein